MKIKLTKKEAVTKKSINEEFIRLDSFLKLINAVVSGGEAKTVIQNGLVSVDGEVCLQRGKKLYNGSRVEFNDRIYEVISSEGNIT